MKWSSLSIVGMVLLSSPILSYTYKSYQTKIECTSKNPILYPKDIDELQTIIKNASQSGEKVKVIGSRHSITDTICTTGTPIHLQHFNYVRLSADKATVTLGTGSELMSALDQLHQLGYTINHIPAYGGITVGGAIGLGAHGSSLNHANTLSEYLVGLTLIDGTGSLRQVRVGDQHFDAFRVNFGLLGALIDVTLLVEPSFKMQVNNYRLEDSNLVNHPNQVLTLARSLDWFQFWWFPSQQGLVLSEGRYLPSNSTVPGDAKTNLISNVSPLVSSGAKLSFELIQATDNHLAMQAIQKLTENSLYKTDLSTLLKKPVFTEANTNKFVNPAVGYNYRLMANKCSPCPWEVPLTSNQLQPDTLTLIEDANITEPYLLNSIPDNRNNLESLALVPDENSVALDLNRFDAVIQDIHQLILEYPTAFPLIGLFFRFSPAAQGTLALSTGRPTFSIDWTFPMRLDQFNSSPYRLHVMQALMQLLVFKHQGRPHWGKNGLTYFQNPILASVYPKANLLKFQLAVQTFDPKGTFSNKFGNRILGYQQEVGMDVPTKVNRCAIQDYCLCSNRSQCSLLKTCSTLWGYPVCKPLI